MAISKVTLNGETLIDVTQDTVAQDNLLTGKTATGADGEKVAGALTIPTFNTQEKTVKSGMETIEVTPDGLPENYSGSIVTFDDSIGDRKLYSLNVGIEPVQSGSGDPSPSNIRPITGWTGTQVIRTGKNIFGGELLRDGVLTSIPSAIDNPEDRSVTFTSSASSNLAITTPCGLSNKFKKETAYTFIVTYSKSSGTGSNLRVYYTDGTYANIPVVSGAKTKETHIYVTNKNKTVAALRKYNSSGSTTLYYDESGIFEGVLTAEEFKPYQGETYNIAFPSSAGTVYGGSLDVLNGTLTVDMAMVDLGTLSWVLYSVSQGNLFRSDSTITNANIPYNSTNFICSNYKTVLAGQRAVGTISCSVNGRVDIIDDSFSDKNAFKTAMSGVQLVYELATPFTVQLTPKQISTLYGSNNIWADCGDVEVSVPSSTNFYDGMSKVTVNPADIYDGSLGDGSSEPINIDPWIRPTEWPDYDKLDISDEECMFFTYDSSDRDGLDFAAFGAECTGGFTVERGYLNNGVWTVENTTDVATKGTYSETLPTDRDYTVYKLKPTTSGAHITRIFMGAPAVYNGYPVVNSNAANYLRTSQKCIERYGNLPYATKFDGPWGCIFLVSETELSVDSVTNMSQMFASCHDLENLDVSKWNTSNVTNMSGAFSGCVSLKFLDVSKWDTSKVTVMNSMFADCNNLRTIDVSNWKTSAVTNMQQLFYNCSELQELDVSEWDVSNVTNPIGLFNSCRSVKSLDVSKWNTSKFTNMSQTFSGCSNLESVDVSNWDTSLVTTTYQMFYQCYSLKAFIATRWNTERLTTISQMFYRCDCLQRADIADWDTSGVTDMGSMFSECRLLQFVDTSKWDTGAVTKMSAMFNNCASLTCFSMNTAKVYSNMLNCCQYVTAFIFTGDSVPTLENTNAFSNNNFANGQRIKFKSSLVEEAKAATNWSTYAAYIEAI